MKVAIKTMIRSKVEGRYFSKILIASLFQIFILEIATNPNFSN